MKQITLAIILTCSFVQTCLSQNYSDSLSRKLQKIHDNSELIGFAVGLVDSDGLIFSEGFGYANKEREIKYSPEHSQHLASISKTFIAVAIMQCIEKGLFTFETPINSILPFDIVNPYFPNDTIRVGHLVNHTSSIINSDVNWKNEFWMEEEFVTTGKDYTREEKKFYRNIYKSSGAGLTEYFKSVLVPGEKWYSKTYFGKYPPGTRCTYSSVGSNIAALVVEHAQGVPYEVYVKDKIWKPLKMENTVWYSTTTATNLSASTYSTNGLIHPRYNYNSWPDGCVESSVSDLGYFLQDMINGLQGKGKLLKPESYKKMFEQTVKEEGPYTVGVFWMKNTFLNNYEHSGSGVDISAVIGINEDDNIGYILMSNRNVDQEHLWSSWIDIYGTVMKYKKLITVASTNAPK